MKATLLIHILQGLVKIHGDADAIVTEVTTATKDITSVKAIGYTGSSKTIIISNRKETDDSKYN